MNDAQLFYFWIKTGSMNTTRSVIKRKSSCQQLPTFFALFASNKKGAVEGAEKKYKIK